MHSYQTYTIKNKGQGKIQPLKIIKKTPPPPPPAPEPTTPHTPGEVQLDPLEQTQINVPPTVPTAKIDPKALKDESISILPDAIAGATSVTGKGLIKVFHHLNTSYHETHPVFSPDGQTLFFARGHCPENTGGNDDPQDIYFSKQNPDGSWALPQNMEELNNNGANGVACISADSKQMLLIHSYGGMYGFHSEIAFTEKKDDGTWKKPKPLRMINYYNLSSYADFIWTPDQKAIIMALHRDDSVGGMDLFVSEKMPNGMWGIPKNLGTRVNTTEDEFAPYMSADGRTLYFSSEGHKGYGQSDIFKVTRLSDTSWTQWSAPENLGSHINTDKWEAYFTVSTSTGNICFVRAEDPAKQRNSDLIQISFTNQELNEVFKEANTNLPK
ncbi:TolB family protein [Flexibacter flexilis]|uniref:TolB family protein n=1 Tax=Flexibacter flexilis TaxID=998 RepID=UPI0015A6A0EB|nr:PD40 domain-containing protein [Flexibacter flexilis]